MAVLKRIPAGGEFQKKMGKVCWLEEKKTREVHPIPPKKMETHQKEKNILR